MCGAHALCCTWCVFIVQYGLLAAPPTLCWARHACCWPVAAVRVHPVHVLVSAGCCSQAGLLSAPTTVYPEQSLVTALLKHDGSSRGMGKIVRRWQQVGGTCGQACWRGWHSWHDLAPGVHQCLGFCCHSAFLAALLFAARPICRVSVLAVKLVWVSHSMVC